MRVYSYLSLVNCRGVHREVESEGSRRQSFDPRNTNIIQGKRIRTKWRMLVKLGRNKSKAWEYANTRKSYWHTANSFILTRTITTQRLKKAGYPSLLDYYIEVRV